MNPDTTPLLSMTDSVNPENITNAPSGPIAVIKSSGLVAADALFNIHSEKPVGPKATKMTSPAAKEKSPIQETPSTASSASSASSATSTVASTNTTNGAAQLPAPSKPPGEVRVSYNSHLAALMRQYEMISHNSKLKPVALGTVDVPPTKPPTKQSISIPANGLEKTPPCPPIQHVFPAPCRSFGIPSVSGLGGVADGPLSLLNFGAAMPGYGWPIMPFPNPFTPGFMQCYAYPPQLSLLQNHFAFQPPPPTPLVVPPTIPTPNSTNKKRKASSAAASKAQIKRAKEIEKDMLQLSLHSLPQLQAIAAFSGPVKSD